MEAVPAPAMSMVGKLLEEVSWEHVTSYRQGGRGRENVLCAEVMMALDFLPATASLVQQFVPPKAPTTPGMSW